MRNNRNFIIKYSRNEKNKKTEELEYNRTTKFDIFDKSKYKYGVFPKKGYKCVRIFKTKEEAERYIKNLKFLNFEVRKIIGW